MKHTIVFFATALMLALGTVAHAGPHSAVLTIVYTGNSYGEYEACPT